MSEILMWQHGLAWAGFALLGVLSLPFAGTRKLVLEVYAWGLRLTLLALLAAGAVLWFRPELWTAEAEAALELLPAARSILPAPGEPTFGLAAAILVAAVLLPAVAVLDVTRKLAGGRLRRLRQLADGARPEAHPAAADGHAPNRPTAARRLGRRDAADALADVGSRRPFRVSDQIP